MITVAENLKLKSQRVLCGFTHETLAKAVGVSRQTIVSREKGTGNPSLDLCNRICKTLNKRLGYLFGEDE